MSRRQEKEAGKRKHQSPPISDDEFIDTSRPTLARCSQYTTSMHETSTEQDSSEEGSEATVEVHDDPVPGVPSQQCDEETQFSLLSRTQPEKGRRDRRPYERYAILGEFFKPIKLDGRKIGSVCLKCGFKVNAHMNKRLFYHLIKQCKEISEEERRVLQQEQDGTIENVSTESRYNYLLVQTLVKNNLPFRLVECQVFRRLCRADPPREFPSRHRLADHYLKKLCQKLEDRFKKEVAECPKYSLSIEFDHWTDATHRSLLAILATKRDGTRYLMDVEDVSITGHSAESILLSLNRVLEKIEPLKINSIVSDAASSCTKARIDFVSQNAFKHVVHQRCIAHLLNLIGKDISEHEDVEDMIKQATKLVSFLSTDTKIAAEFAQAGQRRCARYVKTRWYSTVSMLESIIECQDLAVTAINDVLNSPSSSNVNIDRIMSLNALQSDLFGPNLVLLVSIYRPLANCIAVAEGESSRLGETMKAMLEFARSLFEADWEVSFVLPTIMAFLKHFNSSKLTEDGLGIMIAAYFLDKRNLMNYVTQCGCVLVLETLYNLARNMGYTIQQIGLSLDQELQAYINQDGSFSQKTSPDEAAEVWWQRQPDVGILKSLALRVVSLRSSSANVERLFSTMKVIQGTNRHRLALETFTRVARARISNRWSEDLDNDLDEFDAGSLETSRTASCSSHKDAWSILIDKGAQAFERNMDKSLGAIDTDDDNESASSTTESENSQPFSLGFSRTRGAKHHLPKKLKSKELKKSYKQFFRLFDFTIENTEIEETHEEVEENDERYGLKAVLSRFKTAIKPKKK